jgi:hypothetical protein
MGRKGEREKKKKDKRPKIEERKGDQIYFYLYNLRGTIKLRVNSVKHRVTP